jgi:hypothetical protein
MAVVAVAAITAGLACSTAQRAGKTPADQSARLLGYSVVAHTQFDTPPFIAKVGPNDLVVTTLRRIMRFNATTMQVTATRMIRGTHGASLPLAYGGRSVWAINAITHTLLRIDPTTLQVVRTTALGGEPRAAAFGDGNVWVTVFQPSQHHRDRHVLERFGPATGQMTRRIVVRGTHDSEEIVVGDVVAVAGWRGRHIQLIDPTTMRTVRSLSGRGTYPKSIPISLQGPPRLVSLDGAIYLSHRDGSIVRLATDGPETTVFTKQAAARSSINPGAYPTSAAGLLWVQGATHLYGIDPTLEKVTAVSAAPGGPATDSSRARYGWVMTDSNSANGPIFALVTSNGRHFTFDRLTPDTSG